MMMNQQRSFLEHTDDAGSRLPIQVRTKMEAAFSADFSQVQIYEEPAVLRLGTIACMYGTHIYFAPGAYDPWSQAGQEVLGHELAHVLQQRYGRVQGSLQHDVLMNADQMLEAEAAVAGRRAARGEPVHIPGVRLTSAPRAGCPPVIQCYTVVPPAAHGANAFAFPNPVWHAPGLAVNVSQDTFVGQDKGGALAQAASSFLRAGGAPNLNSVNPAGVTLRLSANGHMAIEDANLNIRQPKVFYATQAIINESNARLQLLGSQFRLVPDAAGAAQQRITVGGQTLLRVTPQNVNNGTTGFNMSGAQQCDVLVENVVGAQNLVPRFEQPLNVMPHILIEYHVAKALLPAPQPGNLDDTSAVNRATSMRNIAVPYGTAARGAAAAFVADLQQYGLNEYAAPEVGEGFVSSSLIAAAPGASVQQGAMPPTYSDYYHVTVGGNPYVVYSNRTWGSHWGGVVAKDGADVVTLENYARTTEDAVDGPDARYYFQMYNTNPPVGGQGSWHHTWASTPMQAIAAPGAPPPAPHLPATHEPAVAGAKGFANPMTMRVTVPNTRYDAIAATLYGGVNIDTIKDNHALIAAAGNAQMELSAVLIALQYANVHLGNNQAGDRNRVQQWLIAVRAALMAARFRQNLQAIEYTNQKIGSMRTH